MQVIDAPVKSGALWLKQAFVLLRDQPLNWIALTWTWLLLTLFSGALPAFLSATVLVLQPALFAGLMIACRDQEQGKPVTLAHLGAGFRVNGRALVVVGAISLLVHIPVIVLSQYLFEMVDFPQTIPMTANDEIDLAAFSAAVDGKVWVLGVQFALTAVINGLFWFATPLLAFRAMPPLHAIRWSIYALAANFLPLIWMGILLTLVLFAGFMAFFVGIVLVLPLIFIVNYTSYRHIFPGD